MESKETLETTLKDLMVVLTEEAFVLVEDEKEANKLVAYMLGDLLLTSEPISQSWH